MAEIFNELEQNSPMSTFLEFAGEMDNNKKASSPVDS
jgi:hypothetical protein